MGSGPHPVTTDSVRSLMRKIILFMSVSLDGFFEGPTAVDWHLVDDDCTVMSMRISARWAPS